MKKGLVVLFLIGVVLSCGASRVYGQADWDNASRESGKNVDSKGLRNVLAEFLDGIQNMFNPSLELVSPVILRLTSGVRSHPEAAFDANEGPSLVRIQEGEEGVRIYSFGEAVGDFSNKAKDPVSSSDVSLKRSSESVDKGEVWGARITVAEEEISGWTHDSGVILTLLTLASLVFLVLGFSILRKVLRAAFPNL